MKCCVVLLLFVNIVNSAKILTLSLIPSYSHQAVYVEVWKELALRGHQVVSITTHPANDSTIRNLREIDISFVIHNWRQGREIQNSGNKIVHEYKLLAQLTREIYQLQEIHDLKNESFDLVIAEWVFPAAYGYSAYFNAPLIGIKSLECMDILLNDIGNPVHPVVYPGPLQSFKTATSFKQRLTIITTSIWLKYIFYSYVYPESNDIIKTYIDSNLPPVEEIIKNTSLVLVNSNFIFHKPKQNLPNIIEFSGLHIKKPKPLPKDIQTFLDNATSGAIYISFGSYIKSSMISANLKHIILNSLKELPYKVIWKIENENITTSPNIMISKWLPQQDILSHKNIKLFITHGGLQSIEEAVRKRVPMIGIPFFLDQPGLIESLSNLGIAVYVDKSKISKEDFKKIIVDVIENPLYRKKIEEVANILEDVPIENKENVIWWIEYVLRHKGAHHLRSPFLDIPWYQFIFLDVLIFFILCFVVIVITAVFIFKSIFSLSEIWKQKNE